MLRRSASFLLVSALLLLCGTPVQSLPHGLETSRVATRVVRRDSSGGPQTVTATNTEGGFIETCTITLTPTTDSNGNAQVIEVSHCTVTAASGSSIAATPTGTTASPSPTVASQSPSSVISSSATAASISESSSISSSVVSSSSDPSSTAAISASSSDVSVTASSPLSVNPISSVAVSATDTSSSAGVSSSAISSVTSSAASANVPSVTASSATSQATASSGSPGTSVGDATAQSATAAADASSASASASAAAAFAIPGKTLQVLPIGLGVFAGISVIALIVVALVTYERTKYRRAFRQRKLAETGASMGYGGTAESLQRVDGLKITFLVDNALEWMQKLPPGFSSEASIHLSKSPPIDSLTGVPLMDLENYCCGAHGFSALIETHTEGSSPHTVLFDTGPDSKSIIRNVESMQVSPQAIERVIISHWHSDHSGGLLSLLRFRNEKCSSDAQAIVADLHPSRPIARGIAPPPRDKVICRLPEDPSFDAIKALGADVELHADPHAVAGNTVFVSGEIPRVTEFEQGLLGGMRWVQEESGYAAIDVLGKGLVIFSACSHAGIVNVVIDAVKTFQRPIYMIIGGFHLAGPELAHRIAPTVEFLSKKLHPLPTYVLPMHCSGFDVKAALKTVLGEGCIASGVGIGVNVQGDAEADKSLSPSVIA
ncbi:hypothetical protein EW145_g3969 [Phellinidium pouzarii]|uniref:Metallo-beta-lactamase domain-containing protein n=1 Tax=Phellinidium pouzarii TaxID=167371 RepID=A0A4S4LAE6_9AGAM|nr:hypothetical protein EW145_g3969 [Phellinidium pouzarii]